RVIRGPHDVPAARQLANHDAGAILNEGSPDIGVHVVARWILQFALSPETLLFPGPVHVLTEPGKPANARFHAAEAQFGKTIEDAIENEDADRFGHIHLAHRHVGQEMLLVSEAWYAG